MTKKLLTLGVLLDLYALHSRNASKYQAMRHLTTTKVQRRASLKV